MANTTVKIKNKVRGDDIPIIRRYVDLPEGDPVIKARLTVKTNTSTADPGIFQLTIDTTEQPSGVIEDGTTPEVLLTFVISKVNSLLMSATITYLYDIQVDTQGGRTYTCEKGTIKLEEQVTQAAG